jgi:purine nucleoside phosphorylase
MTNSAAGVLDQPLTSEEVVETATTVAARLSVYLKKIIERIGEVVAL